MALPRTRGLPSKSIQALNRLDSENRYALHDTHKYPIERLLGAGGMRVSVPPPSEKKAARCGFEAKVFVISGEYS
ncbi:MAG: hypothetical protein ABFS56_08965 [Pseudomonadota bacterium]